MAIMTAMSRASGAPYSVVSGTSGVDCLRSLKGVMKAAMFLGYMGCSESPLGFCSVVLFASKSRFGSEDCFSFGCRNKVIESGCEVRASQLDTCNGHEVTAAYRRVHPFVFDYRFSKRVFVKCGLFLLQVLPRLAPLIQPSKQAILAPCQEPPPRANPAPDKDEQEHDEGDEKAEEIVRPARSHAAVAVAVGGAHGHANARASDGCCGRRHSVRAPRAIMERRPRRLYIASPRDASRRVIGIAVSKMTNVYDVVVYFCMLPPPNPVGAPVPRRPRTP